MRVESSTLDTLPGKSDVDDHVHHQDQHRQSHIFKNASRQFVHGTPPRLGDIDHGVSSFGLRVGDFRFRASDFRISGFGFVFCVFCFVWGVEVWEFQISSLGLEFRGSGSGSRSSARGWRLGRPEARNDHQAHAQRPREP